MAFKFNVVLIIKNVHESTGLYYKRVYLQIFCQGRMGQKQWRKTAPQLVPENYWMGKRNSAFKNELHGGEKRYRCCDTGKLAVANIPLSLIEITLLACYF